MALTLTTIAGPNGLSQNVGGTTKRFFVAKKSDFTAIIAKAEMDDAVPPTNPSELIEIDGDHTFGATKGFIEVYNTRDSGNVETSYNTERDTNGMKVVYKLKHPGLNAATLGKLVLAMNDQLICLVEMVDGKIFQIGTERFPAELKMKFMSGQNESGYRGCEIEVTGFETTPIIYSGVITMAS